MLMAELSQLQSSLCQSPVGRTDLLRLSEYYRDSGTFGASARCLLCLLRFYPADAEALFWLAQLGELAKQPDLLAALEMICQYDLPDDYESSSYLLFALARVRERQHCWQESFDMYCEANRLQKKALGLLNTDAV